MKVSIVIPTRILVFAKAPVSGRVKTRLIPALGAPGAARLARRLLDHTLAQAMAAGSGAVELCASPNFSAPDWADVPLPPGVATSAQGDGDLGARLVRAARRHLAQGVRVLLIGADCPALSAVRLQATAAALADHDAALYPALDGGYRLLGLRADHPSLFADIPWSTAQVAAVTRARMQALGWRVWIGGRAAGYRHAAGPAPAPGVALGDRQPGDGRGLWLTHAPVPWPSMNKIVDTLRSRRREVPLSDMSNADDEDEGFETLFDRRGFWATEHKPHRWADPEGSLEQQFWQVFELCLDRLPARTARVFMMRELLGLETAEICQELAMAMANCWVILHRARPVAARQNQ